MNLMLVSIIGLTTKLKTVTTLQCSYAGDAPPLKSFKPRLYFYQLTTQFVLLSNVHHNQKGVYLSTHHFLSKYLHTRTIFQTKQRLMDELMDGQMDGYTSRVKM